MIYALVNLSSPQSALCNIQTHNQFRQFVNDRFFMSNTVYGGLSGKLKAQKAQLCAGIFFFGFPRP